MQTFELNGVTVELQTNGKRELHIPEKMSIAKLRQWHKRNCDKLKELCAQYKTETRNIQAAFVVVLIAGSYQLGLAHRGVKGYSPEYGKCYSMANPSMEAETYDEASEWAEYLNEVHYGHTFKEAASIIGSTMF